VVHRTAAAAFAGAFVLGAIVLAAPASADPLDNKDFDADGLVQSVELRIGTNPNDWDTDDDGFNDGQEHLDMLTNPLAPNGPAASGSAEQCNPFAWVNPLFPKSAEESCGE